MVVLQLRSIFFLIALLLVIRPAYPQGADQSKDYLLGAGDVVRINVFQNPELITETRVMESGVITFPLVGEVQVAGVSTTEAERRIAQRLMEGSFVLKPQVNMIVLQFRGLQVSVLGQVNRPGKYPFEAATNRLTEALSLAGGVTPQGADMVTIVRRQNGKEESFEVDVPQIFKKGDRNKDFVVMNGDVIYVPRAPTFYVYGEVQRPGQYRVERDMTVMQAIAVGGGITPQGSESRLRLTRRNEGGQTENRDATLEELIRPDDVLYVKQSLF